MIDRSRLEELADYLGVAVDENADPTAIARSFGCDEAYLVVEPDLPDSAVTALARMSRDLSKNDLEEAKRFAAYLAHAQDD